MTLLPPTYVNQTKLKEPIPSASAESELSLQMLVEKARNLLALLKKHHVLFFSAALFVMCWMLAYSLIGYQPRYASQSMVMIKDSALTDRYVLPDQYYAVSTTTSSSANPVLNAMGLLRSEQVSKALWQFFQEKYPEELKKYRIKTRADWESFYGNGKAFIKAKNEPGTDLISVKFVWTDPKIAKDGLDAALLAFQKASLNLNREEQEVRSRYLDEQVLHMEKKLENVRRKKSEYKSEMKIASLSRESEVLATAGIDLASRLSQVEAGAKGKQAEYERYRNILNLSPEHALTATALGMNQNLARLQNQYYELSQNYALLKTTLTEKNPKVKEVLAQMSQVEESIKVETRRTLGQAVGAGDQLAVADATRSTVINQMVAAQAESIRLATEAEVLRARMDEVQMQIQRLPNLEQALTTLEDEERSLSSALATLRQKQMEAKLKVAETLSNVFIVDPPHLPTYPKFPNRTHLWVMGFMLSIAAGLGAVIFKIILLEMKLQTQPAMLTKSFRVSPQLSPSAFVQALQSKMAALGKCPDGVQQDPSYEYPDMDAFLTDVFGHSQEHHSARTLPREEGMRRLKQRLYLELKAVTSSQPPKRLTIVNHQ